MLQELAPELTDCTPGALRSAKLPKLEVARDGTAEATLNNIDVKIDFDGPGGRLIGSGRAEAAFPERRV